MTSAAVVVVLGPCDTMRAEVFVGVALPDAAPGRGLRLEGTLTGPRCRGTNTLPMTARVAGLPAAADEPAPRPADRIVGRAILTEPSFWTPELPSLYQVDLRVRDGDRDVAVHRAVIGLRRLGVRGRSLWLDGRRWVPRGIGGRGGIFEPVALRELAATAVVPEPGEALLAEADVAGVAVIAVSADGGPGAAGRIASWATHPSVMMAVVHGDVSQVTRLADAVRGRTGTLLLAWEVPGALPPPRLPEGVDCLVAALDRGALPHEAWRRPPAAAVLAREKASPPVDGATRPSPHGEPAAELRRACDALQASLATWGLSTGESRQPWEWAGYLVW